MKTKQAIILAGGKGTRLGSLLGDLPKPLLPVDGIPVLDRQLQTLRRQGVQKVLILSGYRAEAISSRYGNGEGFGLQITHAVETEPLGTAGALLAVRDQLEDEFWVCYGDTLFNLSLNEFETFHTARRSDITLWIHPNNHPQDSDLVEMDADGKIIAFHGYPHPPGTDLANRVNAAFYLMKSSSLKGLKDADWKGKDLTKHLFPKLAREGQKIFGYLSAEYIKDMGTPERLHQAEQDLHSGRFEQSSLEHPRPAVFFDRDGTLTSGEGYITRPDQIALFSEAAAAVKKVNKSGPLAVLITNQPVIARGDCTEADLEKIHARLEMLLGREGAFLDRIYFCPHHPDSGFAGERKDLKIMCSCRKPGTGMIERAQKDMNIDLSRSWMIGDSTVDLQMARKIGVKSILVRTGEKGLDARYPAHADYTADHLAGAVDWILNGHPHFSQLAQTLPLQAGAELWIGGQARAGKSTLAQVLRELAVSQKITAQVISLDGWILEESKRTPGTWGRFDQAGFLKFLAQLRQLRAQKKIGTLQWPTYSRETRAPHAQLQTATVNPAHDLLIFEGVWALNPQFRDANLPSTSVFVRVEETARKARFTAHYLTRGYNPEAIEALWLSRKKDEFDTIEDTRKNANLTIDVTE